MTAHERHVSGAAAPGYTDKDKLEDVKVLHGMGYAQELDRRMKMFSNFAISFSIICILAGGITTFHIALSSGGPFSVTVGWAIGGVFALVVAASLGQIGSAYPTAGGLYHWSSILGGRGWGWITAWLNMLGLIFVVASVNFGVFLLFRDLVLAGVFGMDVSGWTSAAIGDQGWWVQSIVITLITITQALFNHYGIRDDDDADRFLGLPDLRRGGHPDLDDARLRAELGSLAAFCLRQQYRGPRRRCRARDADRLRRLPDRPPLSDLHDHRLRRLGAHVGGDAASPLHGAAGHAARGLLVARSSACSWRPRSSSPCRIPPPGRRTAATPGSTCSPTCRCRRSCIICSPSAIVVANYICALAA